MTTRHRTQSNTQRESLPTRWYRGADIPMRVIRRFARDAAERFQPEKIILFGSHAYGQPHADSDVDILVIMHCRNEIDQAVKISLAVDSPFTTDLIVRKPRDMEWRLAEGDWFLRDIVSKGKVLYEAPDGRVGAKSGKRPLRRKTTGRRRSSSTWRGMLSLPAIATMFGWSRVPAAWLHS